MAKFKPYNINQTMLLPLSIHDFVKDGSLAKLVNKVVEQLDTKKIEDKYSEYGQNSYSPKILLKLLFYGYAMGERSGRKIEYKCQTDTGYMYLSQMYNPNFRTINDFRKNNLEEISGYFVKIVHMCKEFGMIKIGQINIDGTKIKANASNRRTKTKDEYKKWKEKIEKRIEKILEEAEEVDREEDLLYGDKRGDELPEAINTEEKLDKKIEEVMKKMKEEEGKRNLTDPDARFMKSGNGRIDTSYNCQVAVTEEQIIISSEVLNKANDRKALELMVETSEKNLGEEIKEVAADAGYSSYENYEYLESRKKCGYIPDQNMNKGTKKKRDRYHYENFQYDKKKDEYICPEGNKLTRYKMRRQVSQKRKWKQIIYKGKSCMSCASKAICTKQKFRTIARDERTVLLEEMRERLRSEKGRSKYKKRMYTVEPVFGHIKFNLGYKHFLLRTIEKVKGEFRLMCIGANLKKMNNMLALKMI